MIDLRAHYRQEAGIAQRTASNRLKRGQGVGGRRLVSKDRPDGKPLGGSVARDLRRGRVSVSRDGFRVDYSHLAHVVRFSDGAPGHGQPARPVIGLTSKERRQILSRTRAEVVRQLNRGVR